MKHQNQSQTVFGKGSSVGGNDAFHSSAAVAVSAMMPQQLQYQHDFAISDGNGLFQPHVSTSTFQLPQQQSSQFFHQVDNKLPGIAECFGAPTVASSVHLQQQQQQIWEHQQQQQHLHQQQQQQQQQQAQASQQNNNNPTTTAQTTMLFVHSQGDEHNCSPPLIPATGKDDQQPPNIDDSTIDRPASSIGHEMPTVFEQIPEEQFPNNSSNNAANESNEPTPAMTTDDMGNTQHSEGSSNNSSSKQQINVENCDNENNGNDDAGSTVSSQHSQQLVVTTSGSSPVSNGNGSTLTNGQKGHQQQQEMVQ